MKSCSSPNINKWLLSLEKEFDFKSNEYESLFSEADATIFQSPYWLDAFYSCLVEALSVEPVIITLRDETDRLQLVLPCIRQQSGGIKIVQPADMGVSDYNCIVARNNAIEAILASNELQNNIVKALMPYDVFIFRKQRSDKPRIEEILIGASISAADFNSYEVELEGSFEAWSRQNMSKQFRSTNRAKLKKLNAQIGSCQFETLFDKASVEKAMAFIRDNRSSRYEGDLLLQPAFFNFYRTIAVEYAKDGFAQTFAARINGEIVAAVFGLNLNGRYCFLLCGFLFDELGKYSIGGLTTSELIRDRVEIGSKIFDFALGDENYKKRYNTRAIEIQNAVYTNSMAGTLVSLVYQNAKPLKNLLKKFNPKLS